MTKKNQKTSIAKFATRILNVREWMDWDRIKSGGLFVKEGAKKVFIANASQSSNESFEEACSRLKLDDTELTKQAKALFFLSIGMLCLAFALIGYAIYHFVVGRWHAGLLLLSLSFIASAFSFRYHFWRFQIKSHKLGCTLSEWFHQGLLGIKK
jgi:intracellular multiplication protein IcmV